MVEGRFKLALQLDVAFRGNKAMHILFGTTQWMILSAG